jgi:hypothetical protein
LTLSYPQLFEIKDEFFNLKFNRFDSVFLFNPKEEDKNRMIEFISTSNYKTCLIDINSETDDVSLEQEVINDKIFELNHKNEVHSIGQYQNCAMGGSFDHPHVGHKVTFY